MATISDLNISITSMSLEKAFEMVKELRLSRRTPKKKIIVKGKARLAKPKTKPNMLEYIKNLPIAERRKFISMLEGM